MAPLVDLGDIDSEQLAMMFAPGRQVDVLLAGRVSHGERSVRQARILGQQEGDLAMSHPQPPLPAPVLGQPVEVTVVWEGGDKPQRYGFQTSVLDTLDDFPDPEGAGRAVVVMFPRSQDVYPTSLRQARRFAVPPDGFLTVRLEGAPPLTLRDISVKGMRLFWPGELPAHLDLDAQVQPILLIHEQPFQVPARVAGIQEQPGGREISLDLGILRLDVWTSLLVALHELEHGAPPQDIIEETTP